jgi:D-lactate dehydrogenase (cytochrome)/homoserine O-acetyltransferase
VIVVASCGRHTDWAIGLGEVQRAVISTDVNYKGGFYKEDSKPLTGLATARMMAMLSYRAPVSVDEKFSRGTMDEGTKDQRPTFAVESYLRYQGDKFIQRFDTNCYLSLINCLDTHDVAAGRGEYFAVLATVEQRTLVVGIDSDMLYPMALSEELSRYLPNGDLLKINSPHGHDSFLIEIEELNEALIRFRMGQPVAAGAALAAAAAAKGVEALTEALTEAVGRQTSLEKEVVRLNLKLQQMEAKLLKATQVSSLSVVLEGAH